MSLAATLPLPIQATPLSQQAKASPAEREPPPKRPFAEMLQQSRTDAPVAPVASASPVQVQVPPADSMPSDDGDAPADATTDSADTPARSLALRPRVRAAGGMTTCSAPIEAESAARVATAATNEPQDDDTSDSRGLAAAPPAAELWRAIVVAPDGRAATDAGVGADRAAATNGASPTNGAAATNGASAGLGAPLAPTAFAEPSSLASEPARQAGSDAAGGAAALAAATPNARSPTEVAPAAAPAPFVVATPVDSPDFPAAFGLQVSLLAKDGVQQAELHLNPPDLGPVSIRIALAGNEARIDFGADLAATRHAIEQGLPELAGALRDAGFTLAGGGVSQHAGERHGSAGGSDEQRHRHRHRRLPPIAAVDASSLVRAAQAAGASGVDLYV